MLADQCYLFIIYFILFYSFIFLRVLLRVSFLIRWKNTKWVKKSLLHVRNAYIRKRKYMPLYYKLHSYCIVRPNRNIWKGTHQYLRLNDFSSPFWHLISLRFHCTDIFSHLNFKTIIKYLIDTLLYQ